ncbi:MAG: DUF4393 domain-containing protein [Thomasclavelia sp.]
MGFNYLEKKAIDAASDTSKGFLNKLLGPSAEELGNRLSNYVEKKLDESAFWGPLKKKQCEENIIETLKTFANEYSNIPEKDKKEISVNIVAPIIDSLMTYFEEPNYKEMFGKLLAASFNRQKQKDIHPSFTEIIKQLNSLDAKLLIIIKEGSALPYVKLFGRNTDGSLTPFLPELFIYAGDKNYSEFDIVSSLENLERLKLITIRNDILCFAKEYETFKSRETYKIREQILPPGAKIEMHKFRVELTQTGMNFVNVCC